MRERSIGWIIVGLGLFLGGTEAEEPRASIEAQGAPLREVLGPLAWHTGREIGLEGVGETPITLCLRDQPLENLLELLGEAAGCQVVKTERGYLFHPPESVPEAASRVRQWLAGPFPAAPSRRTPHAPLAYRFLAEESEAAFVLELRLTGQPWPSEEPVRVVFHFRDSQDYDGLLMGGRRIGFVRVRGGLVEPLGTAGEFNPPAPGETVTLTLTCRGRERRALINHELQAQAFEDSRPGHRIGYFLPAGVTGGEPIYQPLHPPRWTDTSRRMDGSSGGWEPLSGQWTYSSPQRPDAGRNTPSFLLHGVGSPAQAMAGLWFWEDYHFEAAVKPAGPGAVGLSFYGQDAHNFLLFRWTSPDSEQERQFWLVQNGTARLLAGAEGGYEPGRWYRLAVRLAGRYGEALIDGQPILQAHLPGFTQGRVGLYAEGPHGAFFDNISVSPAGTWETPLHPQAPDHLWDITGMLKMK